MKWLTVDDATRNGVASVYAHLSTNDFQGIVCVVHPDPVVVGEECFNSVKLKWNAFITLSIFVR